MSMDSDSFCQGRGAHGKNVDMPRPGNTPKSGHNIGINIRMAQYGAEQDPRSLLYRQLDSRLHQHHNTP